MTDIKTVLKPCPFCGGENISLSTPDYRWICMTCADCGSECGHVRSTGGESAAIAAWNTRAAPVDAQEAVDAKLLQQARDALNGMMNKRGYGCGDGSDHQVERHNTAANTKATEAIAAIDAALQASQSPQDQVTK